MNFFERQDAARKGTRALLVVFMLAVICIVVAINVVLAVVWVWLAAGTEGPKRVPGGLFAVVTLVTVGVILAVSFFKMAMLRMGGGAAVARMVGARHPGSGICASSPSSCVRISAKSGSSSAGAK